MLNAVMHARAAHIRVALKARYHDMRTSEGDEL